MNLKQKLRRRKIEVYLFLILIFSLIIRLYFFVGLANCDPQDDSLYLGNVRRIIDGNFFYDKNLLTKQVVNPGEVPSLRPLFLYIVSASQLILGVNDFSSTLFSIVCSLGTIILIFLIGDLFFNKKVGLVAALLLSFFPLDVIFSTRILPDIALIFFMTLSIYLFLKGEKNDKEKIKKNRNRAYYILSGISFFLGFDIKEIGLVFGVFFVLYMLYDRKIKSKYLWIILGFLFIFVLESLFFYSKTGDFLFRYHILSKARIYKYTASYVPYKINTVNILGNLIIHYPQGYDFFFHIKSMFHSVKLEIYSNYFGWFPYFVLFSMFYVLFKREKKSYILLLWLLALYLYIEFGPLYVNFDVNTLTIDYMMIFKESDSAKFATILTVPSLLLLAYFICDCKNYLRGTLPVIIILFLLLSSIPNMTILSNHFRNGMNDTREANKFFREYFQKNSEKKVYGDYIEIGQISYYFGYKKDYLLKNINDINDSSMIKDSFVIIGGARGCIFADSIRDLYPEFAQNFDSNPPKNWELAKIISGEVSWLRKYPMKIYYVP